MCQTLGVASPKSRGADVSELIYRAWVEGPGSAAARTLASRTPVPGSVALRGRFHLLADPAVPAMPAEMFHLGWDAWQAQVTLTAIADSALISNDIPAARAALAELVSTHERGLHQLPLVDAEVGLGDAARQADEFEEAAGHYDRALELASAAHYRFGTVRALVPVGYLTMMSGSVLQAAGIFRQAVTLASELDERTYLAGALTGLGEALGRLRDDTGAREALATALELFEALRSDGGVVNAAQHLGDLHRRNRELGEAHAALSRALVAAQRSGLWIGVVNARDGLGEVALGQGDVPRAVGHYQQAYQLSADKGYRRGQAHALNGLGRCAAEASQWVLASRMHRAALTAYQQLGDLPSSTTALDGLARAASAEGDLQQAVRARLEAVAAIETMRSVQDREAYQREYRERFAGVYSSALRTAVMAKDPAGFVAVFEGLAGRRLAGMLGTLPAAAVEEAQVAAHVLARSHHKPLNGTDLAATPQAERRARLLGRLALRHGMPDVVERAIGDLAAALYRPFARESATRLLADTAVRGHMFLATMLPDRDTEIAWLRAGPGVEATAGIHAVPPAARDLVLSIARDGLAPDARAADLALLADLVPAAAFAGLADSDPLMIVPLGPLWGIPWPGLPVGGAFLGERFALAVTPSLTLADHLGAQPDLDPPRIVGQWRSPEIRFHELVAFLDDSRLDLDVLSSASDALVAATTASHDLVVLAGHGRPVPAMGHFLELGDGVLLTPATLLDARPPARLVLAACWGAHTPGIPDSDPLTIATIALARGSRAVLATTSELADDPLASAFLNGVLHRLPSQSMPAAVRDMTRRFLANTAYRDGYLSRWAPLITIGTANAEAR